MVLDLIYQEKRKAKIYAKSEYFPGFTFNVTGMWQANGRSDVEFNYRCKLDDYYYHNWSIWLDFTIIYKTIKGVVYGKGSL